MDERGTKRVVVDIELDARVGDRIVRVLLRDMSVDGCMIEASAEPWPVVGGGVEVLLPYAGWKAGAFAWAKGGSGGVLFTERLHEAVVHQLGFRPALQSGYVLRDQFGRVLLGPTKQSRLS
jgi:hypothetical protein